ncbi:DUF6443 domain-containing protein, partial [Aquimarina gracilis]
MKHTYIYIILGWLLCLPSLSYSQLVFDPCGNDDAGRAYYLDGDGDGYGNNSSVVCRNSRPPGYITQGGDCNDNDPTIINPITWYRDADGDSWGNANVKRVSCYYVSGYVKRAGDYDDSTNLITNIAPRNFYRDADNDTFGNPNNKVYRSHRPGGYVTNSSDCNDGNSAINPNTVWFKDADGDRSAISTKTQCTSPGSGYTRTLTPLGDCNDNNAALHPGTVWYKDGDGDGFASLTKTQCNKPGPGYTLTIKPLGDCDDLNANVNPNTIWYKDSDGDGFASTTKKQCSYPGSGYSRVAKPLGDCNDGNAAIHPNTIWYKNSDSDGFASTTKKQCSNPGSGYSLVVKPLGDCNDNDATLHPNTVWYHDDDGDGWGNKNITKIQCEQPTDYVRNDDDYNDSTHLITNIAPQTFYNDADGDNFGDPNQSVYYSEMPSGYVTNAQDLCPNEAGPYNGCRYRPYQPVTLSNENYVYTKAYQTAVTDPDQVKFNKDVIESVAYYDGLGRPKQQVAIKGGALGSIKNIFPSDWIPGSGSTPFFNQNGKTSENNRVIGLDPGGEFSLLWQCGNDIDHDADGGWNTDYFEVDKNVGYRYTVWVKRTGSQNGSTYHGTRNVSTLIGSRHNNPYFWHGDLPQLDTWYLIVGIIHPYNYTGSDLGISGVYDLNGNRVIDGNEFKWNDDVVTSAFRSYLYYSTDINTNQFFWNPGLQKLDGTENSISELIEAPKKEIEDIITHIEYDALGRQAKQYLPFINEGNGAYKTVNVTNDINSYYLNKYAADFEGINDPTQVNAYSERVFEASPLNRVLEQGAPGKDWKADPNSNADHTIKFDWQTNQAEEVVYFEVTFTDNNTEMPTLVQDGTHLANDLYVTVTKDENWTEADGNNHTTKEYKDKQGRVILKRAYAQTSAAATGGSGGTSDDGSHDTYYVYDDFGNKTFVIPPKVDVTDGVSAIELNELCYQYKYDYRNRLIEKKIPGKG